MRSWITPCAGWWAVALLPQFVWIGLFLAGHQLSHENGPMETLQIACLAAGAALLIRMAVIAPTAEPRLLALGLAMLYVNFAVRELEIARGQAPDWVVYLLHGRARNAWVAGLWLVLFAAFLRHWRSTTRFFLTWIWSMPGTLLLAGGCALALSWPFDRSLVPLSRQMLYFCEELAESTGTTLMLLAALCALRATRRTQGPGVQADRPA